MRINMHLEEGKKEKGKEKTMIKQINKKKKIQRNEMYPRGNAGLANGRSFLYTSSRDNNYEIVSCQLLANSRYIINQKHKPTRNNISESFALAN